MFHMKEGARSLHISVKNHDAQTEKKLIYLQGFDIIWVTAPSKRD